MDEVRLGSRTLQPRRQLLADGERLPLGKRALDIVSVLAEARGGIVTKDELLEGVWPGIIVEENALQVHIVALRKALGPEADRLKTIRGVGYQLEIDGEAVAPDAEATNPTPSPNPAAAASRAPPDPREARRPAFTLATALAKARSHRLALAVVALLLVLAGAWTVFGDNLGLRPHERIPVVVRMLKAEGTRDGTETALASGITDELIVRLRRTPELRVATADSDGTVPGTAFAGAYVVDGSIRSNGDRLRVTARLLDAGGEILWSQTFDRGLADIFDVQEEIAAAISDALSISFDVGGDSSEFGGTDNPEAFAAYLQFRAHQLDDDQSVPVAYLERALALDPDYGKALNSLSISYGIRASGASSRKVALDLLAEMDRRTAQAVAANPDLWIAHLARAYYYIQRRDLVAADREIRRVAELDKGNDPELQGNLGQLSAGMGRRTKSGEFYQSAVLIEPVLANSAARTGVLLNAGRYQDAIDLFDERSGDNPTPPSVRTAFWAHLLLNQDAEALALADRHGPWLADALREFKADKSFPGRSLAELRAWAKERYGEGGLVELSNEALLASHYGHPKLAVNLLHVAFERVGGYGIGALWHPAMAETRKTDAFEQLVIELGFVKMWRESGDWGDYCRPVSATEIACH